MLEKKNQARTFLQRVYSPMVAVARLGRGQLSTWIIAREHKEGETAQTRGRERIRKAILPPLSDEINSIQHELLQLISSEHQSTSLSLIPSLIPFQPQRKYCSFFIPSQPFRLLS